MKTNNLLTYLRSMTLTLCCIAFMLLSNNSYAVDMAVLQEQCADIGFKMRTPANGTCVLRLMKGVKNKEAQVLADQQAYENKVAAENAQRQQALEQEKMYQMQKDSLATQQRIAEANAEAAADQRRGRALQLLDKSLQSMSPTPVPTSLPSSSIRPFTCRRNGQSTTCY